MRFHTHSHFLFLCEVLRERAGCTAAGQLTVAVDAHWPDATGEALMLLQLLVGQSVAEACLTPPSP